MKKTKFKAMKFSKIFKHFVLIPNLPFIIILAVYVLIKIYKHTGFVEMQFIDNDSLLNDKIKKHIQDIYPNYLKYMVAFIFYLCISVKLLTI